MFLKNCPVCNGTGKHHKMISQTEAHIIDCFKCEGEGKLIIVPYWFQIPLSKNINEVAETDMEIKKLIREIESKKITLNVDK